MPIFSTTNAKYVKVVFNFSINKWDGVKIWLRVRYDNLQAILYENDNQLYIQRVFLYTVGFFADLKYSVSEHTFFFTIPNYAGAPVLYFEKTKEDTIDYVSYEVSPTPFTYPSDSVDV